MGYKYTEEFMTVQEVADKLKLSELTIYKYIKDGGLSAVEFGGHYRVSSISLQNFLNQHQVEVENE